MKRFKTKQELTRYAKNELPHSISNMGDDGVFGLDVKFAKGLTNHLTNNEDLTTTDPHPFDTMDIKVRVTPKQSKKLQKKAVKMGYLKGEFIDEDMDVVLYYFQGECDGFDRVESQHSSTENYTELTYKQFMNGTVPKKKDKSFKVGDVVMVNCDGISVEDYIGEVTKTDESDYVRVGLSWTSKHRVKHTTKPKEQPLMFKGHEVKKVDDMYLIGCKRVTQNELEIFFHFNKDVLGEHATSDEAMEFMEANKSKLGL